MIAQHEIFCNDDPDAPAQSAAELAEIDEWFSRTPPEFADDEQPRQPARRIRPILLATAEDRQYEAQLDVEAEYADTCCGTGATAEYSVSHGWRGWLVYCDHCGEILDEVDDY